MTDVPRRSVGEILARYEFEPELDDVYVEGLYDKEIFGRCLRAVGSERRVVYEIDTVDVGSAVLEKFGLTSGNKQRVIALAKELAALNGELSYRCVVDRDLDHWISELESVPRMNWTKYCSIELHFLTNELVREFLIVVGRAKITNFPQFMESFVSVLRSVYVLRLADAELELCLEWIELNKFYSSSGDVIAFNRGEYIKRVLNKNGCSGRAEEFSRRVDHWDGVVVGDPRLSVRGHDFVELVAWSMKNFKGIKELSSPVAIERMLVVESSGMVEIMENII